MQRGYDANSEMIFPASELQKHWWLLKSLNELGCDTMDLYGYLSQILSVHNDNLLLILFKRKISSFRHAISWPDCDASSFIHYQI